MKLLEHMGKNYFQDFQIPVPAGELIQSPQAAAAVAERLGPVALKAQVPAGKRGKSGGIAFADTPQQAVAAAQTLQAQTIGGHQVEKLLVEEKLTIDKEFYLALSIDNAARKPVLLASAQGGVDIEAVPETEIIRIHIDPLLGIQPFVLRELNRRLALTGALSDQMGAILTRLYRLFTERDAELAEINPLALCGDKLIAADAKVVIDDDARFRQQDLPTSENVSSREQRARELGFAYIELDGDIAVMANGAGITMATLDLLQHHGGRAANFLDTGGGASEEITARALELMLDSQPRAILLNIFGGITRCDDVARAFLRVKERLNIKVPVIIRLVGTNEQAGRELLEAHGIMACRQMDEAAAQAVAAAKEGA